MSTDSHAPELDEDRWYEECPRCEGRAEGCMTCWDEGLVIHDCEPWDG